MLTSMFATLLLLPFLAFIPAVIAKNKGRSLVLWWLYGVFFFLIALIHALVAQPKRDVLERRKLRSGHARRCPHCAEIIKSEARVCRHCGRDVMFAAA